MEPEVEDAIKELRSLTHCYCSTLWTDDGQHETDCLQRWREDVELLADYICALEQTVMSYEAQASIERVMVDGMAARLSRIIVKADAEDDWKKLL